MHGGDSNGWSSGCSEHPAALIEDEPRSPYAIAQDGLAELIEAAVQAQRVEAMNAAMQVDVIFLTVGHALRSEEAFVPNTLSPQRRREMAHRSVTAELATALHVPERTMERQISEAWALSTTLPVTLRAMRNGRISSRHAAVIVQETTGLDDDPGLRARLDEQLAVIAADTTAATLRGRARALREKLGIESIEARHRAARAERRVELETARDGMAWLHAFLPAEDALLIKDRLDRIARAASDGERGGGAGGDAGGGAGGAGGDARGRDQLRADATRDLLLHGRLAAESVFAHAAATVQPTVHVTVPVQTLTGESAEPGELDGYGPIVGDVARRLAAKAPSFTRLLTHPVSGTVLDVDRTSYRPPADLKRWLEVRDGSCRFPGCNRRAARCEVDHSVDWQHEGRTAFDNLAHLCALHHHLKHETAWSVRHEPDGVLKWTSPAGRTHLTHPKRRIPVGAGTIGADSNSADSSSADSIGPPPHLQTTNESPPF